MTATATSVKESQLQSANDQRTLLITLSRNTNPESERLYIETQEKLSRRRVTVRRSMSVEISSAAAQLHEKAHLNKNSSGGEIENVNVHAVHPEATRIR